MADYWQLAIWLATQARTIDRYIEGSLQILYTLEKYKTKPNRPFPQYNPPYWKWSLPEANRIWNNFRCLAKDALERYASSRVFFYVLHNFVCIYCCQSSRNIYILRNVSRKIQKRIIGWFLTQPILKKILYRIFWVYNMVTISCRNQIWQKLYIRYISDFGFPYFVVYNYRCLLSSFF